jgi:uncharacterized repeat protein (TIGR01451 family)
MQRHKIALFAAATFFMLGASAYARPNVQLKLEGLLVQKESNGSEKLVPIDGLELKSGENVRYVIVATNVGTDAAAKLQPVGRIPVGTTYEPGTASTSQGVRAQFSIDGGKTWASTPTVIVHTANGDVEKKADPSAYTTIRWVTDRALAPKSTLTYSYQVHIK